MKETQKEKNKQYVLDHFEEYVLDSHGNFANSSPDIEGNEWFFCFGKDSFTPEAYEELKAKLFEIIIKEIKDWELVFATRFDGSADEGEIKGFQHKTSKKRINKHAFDHKRNYQIIGELGYRKNSWQNYEETIKIWKEQESQFQENERWFRENITNNNPQSTSPNTEPKNQEKNNSQNPPPQNEPTNNLPPNLNQKNQSNKPNNTDQNNPSPDEEQKTSNNSLPSPTEIQNNYNSDKSKSEIDNNSNLINSNQKGQANKLLKIVISAELLIKKKQFNPEVLTKLITEKKNNISLYQLLNKERRIDKVISKLESIKQQSQKHNNKSLVKNKDNGQIPVRVVLGVGIFLAILGLGVMTVLVKRKRVRRKIKH